MRHASATHALVTLRVEAEALHIDVSDDGTAHASPQPATGHGLRGMAERAAALGGDITAGPADGGGWQVRARLPLSTGSRR